MYQSIHTGKIIDNGISLIKIKEDGNTGLRLLMSNPDNHGYIGDDAIDLSIQTLNSDTTGATGNFSFALGKNTTASGLQSFVQGNNTIAKNNDMFTFGKFNVGTSTETIHETGIGADDLNRKNAFEIYTDGRVVAPELTTALINSPRSLVTKEYLESNGNTANRPVSPSIGEFYFDTDLTKPIWHNGTNWVDSNGSLV